MIADFVHEQGLTTDWILETHAHADHLSAAPWLQAAIGGKIAIGQGIREVQKTFRDILNLEPAFPVDGRQFDRLLADGDSVSVGALPVQALATPGHTSDSLSYLAGDAVFVGDSIFMPDSGTARCDFPGGDAGLLYASIRRLYELPGETRVFVCHDYKPGGREARCETTITAERESNIHLKGDTSEADFTAMRRKRDATLEMPALLYPPSSSTSARPAAARGVERPQLPEASAVRPGGVSAHADRPRLLLIDNYDSFTYNLVQAFLVLGADVRVHRNDEITSRRRVRSSRRTCASPRTRAFRPRRVCRKT